MSDLVLTLRDGLFLKDGREWATSDLGRAHSLSWPMPSTLFGALVTARGRLAEARGRNLAAAEWLALAASTELGPSLPVRRPLAPAVPWAAPHRLWPVPADAFFVADDNGKPRRLVRLDPQPPQLPSLGRDDDAAREGLWRPGVADQAKPAARPPWWPDAVFVAWLGDPAADRPCGYGYRGFALPRHTQSHVGIDPATLAAREEVLFAHDVVEAIDEDRCEWAIGCRIAPNEATLRQATLGGDRRLARIETAGTDIFAFPPALGAAFAAAKPKGLRLVAVTPAAFERGWLPDGFTAASDDTYRGRLPGADIELILRAALVPRAEHVSGWDMAAGRPKPTTRLVPAGAVFHFERADGEPVTAKIAQSLWLLPLGDRTNHGFGRFVPGVWHPAENRA
jgi:CRISPR-associated protein Cmr3